MNAKLSDALVARLNAAGPRPSAPVDVVIELDRGTRREEFLRLSGGVERAVDSLGGDVTGHAWINGHGIVCARLPRAALELLARLDQVRSIDVATEVAEEQLRRVPAPVNARGPAVRLASRNVDRYLETQVERGQVLGFTRPLDWGDPRTNRTAQAYLLLVPDDAHARHYPRAINSVPVRIARSADRVPALAGA